MATLIREAELEYLEDKRERLYEKTADHTVALDILNEKIWEILNERKRFGPPRKE